MGKSTNFKVSVMVNHPKSSQSHSGQTNLEYALIIVLVAVIAILILIGLSGALQQSFDPLSGILDGNKTDDPTNTLELTSTAKSTVSDGTNAGIPASDSIATS